MKYDFLNINKIKQGPSGMSQPVIVQSQLKTILLIIVCFCSIQMFQAQEDDGVVSLSLPVRNSLTFNRYAMNPTFSFVREQNKYISLYNKREWVQFDDAPQTYLASYAGRFAENIGAGIGLFQQNYGVLTTFGGVLNFAYNARLERDSNLTFGLNLGVYKSGVNTGKVVTNFADPSLDNVPSNLLLTVNPGINYGTTFLDFGVSVNNLVLYNVQSSELIQDDPRQTIQAHVMYTGYFDSAGFFDEAKFSGLIRSEFGKETTTISGITMLTVPKGIWAQVGYNTLYGASAGLGLNITSQIAIEYNFEKALGDLTDFGPSHEITLAFKFNNNSNYDYSDEDEISGLFSSDKKRVLASNKPKMATDTRAALAADAAAKREEIRDRAKAKAETRAQLAEEAKAEQELQAQAKAAEENKAKQNAEDTTAQAKKEADIQMKQEAEEKAVAKARAEKALEAQSQLDAQNKAKADVAAKLKAEQEAKAKLAAQEKSKADEKAKAQTQAKLIAEAKAKAEADAIAKLALETKAKAEQEAKAQLVLQEKVKAEEKAKAQAQAKLVAEAKAKADAEAAAKLVADAKMKAEQEAKVKLAAQEKIKADEKAKAQAKAIAEANARAEADVAAKLAAETKAKAEQAAQIELAAQEKSKEEERVRAEAQAKLVAQNKAKAELEKAAQIAAEAKATQQAEAEAAAQAKKLAQQKAIENPTDAIAIAMKSISDLTEASTNTQDELMTRFSQVVASKDKDLKDLKKENDLSEQGIYSAPKAFKSITEENNALEALKTDLDNSIEINAKRIKELETLYEERSKIPTLENDEVNLYYQKALKSLKAEQLKAMQTRAQLTATLKQINEATEFERKRRIKRAVYTNEEDRYMQDRSALKVIKQKTALSTVPLKAADFDFGEEQSNNIQILKNIKNVESGYYVVVAVHNDVTKRDEFLTKAVAAGESNVDFFYDVNTSKYFIYYKKLDSIEAANDAMETRGNQPYNGKMSIIKIEN